MAQLGDAFEEMTNIQLRDQLEQYGLPKVPVTASTRNILIKRLRSHLKDSSAAKVRRETINVVKYSSDEESDKEAAKEKLKRKLENHKQARRATIGGAGAVSAIPVAEKPSRKSGRMTPTKATTTKTDNSVHVAAHVPIIVEDSDEDIHEPEPLRRRNDRRSKSNTPTLAKSDIITTSYKQVVDTVREEEEDPEEEDEPVRYTRDEYVEPKLTRPIGYYDSLSRDTPLIKSYATRDSPLRRTTLGSYGADGGASRLGTTSTSVFSRPSMAFSSTYNTSSYSTYKKTVEEEEDQTPPLEEFPYLSEFSKRLSRLKADPLIEEKPYKRESIYRSGAMARKQSSASVWDPVIALFVRMENQYRLKSKIFILAMVLLAIFVLVLFWN